MAEPIRLQKFDDQPRQVQGRGRPVSRDSAAHGSHLRNQLQSAVAALRQRLVARQPSLPDVPVGIQVLIRGATTADGKSLLESEKLKGLKLQVLEERSEGLVIALSPDPELRRLREAVEDFRSDARTAPTPSRPNGTRKRGVNTVAAIDDVEPTPRSLRMGEELSHIPVVPDSSYLVDIEIAAGRDLGDEAYSRNQEFTEYLRRAGASIVDRPIIEEDYALFRAHVDGRLLTDLLDVHVWVMYVDLPPEVELEGLHLRNIQEPHLPTIISPPTDAATVCIIDSGVAMQHPLLEPAMRGNRHQSFIPGTTDLGDSGSRGHGTAVASVAALGSLRAALNGGLGPIKPVPVVLARILDDYAVLPRSVNVKTVLPKIVTAMQGAAGVHILSHSVASTAQFNPQRMSIWAETIDRVSYDSGGEGCLFVVCTGNVDGIRPALHLTETDIRTQGHPRHLLGPAYRLRNPAQAINALTVGAYVPTGVVSFGAHGAGLRAIATPNSASPCTRTGFGYLGEVKPEVVEDGGNWYLDTNSRIVTRWDVTDVPIAAHDYASSGYLIKFGCGTSFAAPKAHLAAKVQDAIPTRNPDLIRAIVINSARWPSNFGTTQDRLRLFGYGVPDENRAIKIGGPRCTILIEDAIRIGNAQLYRIPWPADLFDQTLDLMIRVSITLAYRAPVRKTNRTYRGTALEWKLSQRGESLAAFQQRGIYQGMSAPSDQEDSPDEEGEATIADWQWQVKTNLRRRGTAQKDWFEAPASYFGPELYLSVLGKRGWLTKEQQDQGWEQRYAVAICIEVLGQSIPIHERIAELVRLPVRSGRVGIRTQ